MVMLPNSAPSMDGLIVWAPFSLPTLILFFLQKRSTSSPAPYKRRLPCREAPPFRTWSFRDQKVSGTDRFDCPEWIGTGVRDASESLSGMCPNTHLCLLAIYRLLSSAATSR